MAVVIRLQGLSVTAGSEDIRKFFTGLRIPDGGVHIIGGERDEAFIIFASDEDARRAMTRSLGCIKGSPVTLLLSSKTEMQNLLERSTKTVELDQKRRLEENARRAGRSMDSEVGRRPGSRLDHTPPPQHQEASSTNDEFLYLFLKGMPFSVTEGDVFNFFSGLVVDDLILFKTGYGAKNGKGIAKFATSKDAYEGLKRDRQYIGSRYVELSPSTEEYWCRAGGKVSLAGSTDVNFIRERSPIRNQRNPQHHARSQSPVSQRPTAASDEEYCVLLDNLSFTVEKDDIKKLFRTANLEDGQILHLMGSDGRRTRSSFVLFRSLRDYCDALSNEKRLFFNRWVYTRPISREKMITLLESQGTDDGPPGNSERFEESPPSDTYDAEKLCLLVRNLPFDVRKVEIMDFFLGFDITEDKVFVMSDHKGDGVGQALVLFRSEAEAMSALALNGQRFLGSEVILKCISRSQMQQLGFDPSMQEPCDQNPRPRQENYSSRSSAAAHQPGDTGYPDFRIPHDGDPKMPYAQAQNHGSYDYEPYVVDPHTPRDRGNGVRGGLQASVQNFDGPTCVQLLNLPFQIRREEIYDFCYGYQIISGSVSLQYDQGGRPKGSATAVFESRLEALKAIEELSGRPIGPRRIQLLLV
ncbi:RNA binding motif protein 12Bb [Notolabrus celidotus]|uniref:RNA binding motif protein 12Bb n=1 Tax=Notolabrus celidotus TaxID=1203425 RepID=UPI00148FE51E|nr:RNA binding motif protein 12Bb [Notolabrus celidotus]